MGSTKTEAGLVIGVGAAIAAAIALLRQQKAGAAPVPPGNILHLDEATMNLLIAIAEQSGKIDDILEHCKTDDILVVLNDLLEAVNASKGAAAAAALETSFAASGGWRYEHVLVENKVVPAGSSLELYGQQGFSGWLLHGIFASTSDYTELRFRLMGAAGMYEAPFTALTLYTYGFTVPTQGGIQPWVTKYLAGPPPIYCIAFSPIFPGLPFHGSSTIVARNPTASSITIYLADFSIIRVPK